ncbi:MAG: hypothetical protein CO126_03110 [Hydrogenophilales bacterium CG_4_9_14_3_um_filter_63_34]|nr:MAG: hypothetical protein CO126_03110 [Hydrogenophilales bacterium CG_4_9_14_3_um_filter_63_34]
MLSREDCLKELGLLPGWRLKDVAKVAQASSPASAIPPPKDRAHLTQGIHSRDYLPHVKAQGATYFITFRLADSLPQDVLDSWRDLPEIERAREAERYLDRGAGECLLARPELAEWVIQALHHHEDRYTLHEFVVMPNHVHLLLTPQPGQVLGDILHGIKSWAAHQINKRLNLSGAVWQRESFDRVVRDDDEMRALAAYIRRNPVKAGLCGEEDGFRFSSAWKNAGEDACATSSEPPDAVPVAQASSPATPVAPFDWPALTAAIKTCTRCDLHKSRTQGVPGVGDIRAEWLFIGEAPGADEDRLGEPFVGQAGKLLDAMLAALRLKRGENVYIANVLKSRPPGNRGPRPEEVAACLPYLERQIDLIKPKLIVALGRIAAQNLLATDTPIGKLRGRVHQYRGVPLVVTYHPAYLLRSPADKARAWEDLVLAVSTMKPLKDPAQQT